MISGKCTTVIATVFIGLVW